VLLEFIADLTGSKLFPADAVERAKTRWFIETATSQFTPGYYALKRGEGPDAVLKGFEKVQSLLSDEGEYAMGAQWTIADAAITPFLARAETALKTVGNSELTNASHYARIRRYISAVTRRKSFTVTYVTA